MEINTTVYDDIVGLYVQYSDEVYSNGVQNINNELSLKHYNYVLLVM
jgi:hypothetical protein